MIRGCRVPGVQLQVVTDEGSQLSAPVGLYSDVCMECGLTNFYARRHEVGSRLEKSTEKETE